MVRFYPSFSGNILNLSDAIILTVDTLHDDGLTKLKCINNTCTITKVLLVKRGAHRCAVLGCSRVNVIFRTTFSNSMDTVFLRNCFCVKLMKTNLVFCVLRNFIPSANKWSSFLFNQASASCSKLIRLHLIICSILTSTLDSTFLSPRTFMYVIFSSFESFFYIELFHLSLSRCIYLFVPKVQVCYD